MAQNNPLNIRYSLSNRWLGLSGQTANGFCNFESIYYGVRAGLVLICRIYRRKGYISIRQIITRFAPPSENDTQKYIEYVSSQSKIYPDEFLSTMREYARVISAMCYFETNSVISSDFILSVAKLFTIDLRKR